MNPNPIEIRSQCCDDVPMPSFEEEVKEAERLGPVATVASFVSNLINHAVAGFPEAPDDVVQARLEICKACPKKKRSFCLICNCFLPEKTKWADQSCPLGLWKEVSQKSDR